MKRFILLLLIASGPAFAVTGNELLADLKSSDAYDNMRAYSYVNGVLDTEDFYLTIEVLLSMRKDKSPVPFRQNHFCPPTGTTKGQVNDMAKKALEANPETRHEKANILLRKALIDAWPCRGNPQFSK